jgi:hypothetical protein
MLKKQQNRTTCVWLSSMMFIRVNHSLRVMDIRRPRMRLFTEHIKIPFYAKDYYLL